jgi:voltage-gated potassium channel
MKVISNIYSKISNPLMLILSLYAMIQLAFELVNIIPEEHQYIYVDIDTSICAVFVFDFIFHLFRTKEKKSYIKNNWIDILSSIPYSGISRIFRMITVIKTIRIFKVFKVFRGIRIIEFISEKRYNYDYLQKYSFYLITAIIYGSLYFYHYEYGVNHNIDDFSDSVWWSFMTITTVGCDIQPVTLLGKIISVVMTLSGMGLFSLVTAEIAAKIIKKNKKVQKKLRKRE